MYTAKEKSMRIECMLTIMELVYGIVLCLSIIFQIFLVPYILNIIDFSVNYRFNTELKEELIKRLIAENIKIQYDTYLYIIRSLSYATSIIFMFQYEYYILIPITIISKLLLENRFKWMSNYENSI